jgi:hypothetical protein
MLHESAAGGRSSSLTIARLNLHDASYRTLPMPCKFTLSHRKLLEIMSGLMKGLMKTNDFKL